MPYLSLIIFLPVVGAIVIALLPKENVKAVKWAAVLFTAASLALSLLVFLQFDPGKTDPQFQLQEKFIWVQSIGVQYNVGVDGLNLPMVALTTFLSFVAVLGSWVPIKFREKEYYALFLILETGILGVFSSLDLLLFFLFWEVELIPMFLLIAIWGGPRREKAATKFVMYTLAGSALMLVGILALYFSSEPRTFDMLALANTSLGRDFQIAVFLLMFAGFAIKLPVVPLHTWLPWAHVEAPTAVSVMLAGVLLKMGAYGMLRINSFILPEATQALAFIIGVLAVVNVIYGAGVSMVQDDMKKMIAFSSVSHMGFVLLGWSALNVVSVNGAALQMFTHGTISGLLFMLVGTLSEKTPHHIRLVSKLGGIAPKMPWLATMFVIASLASLGLPGLSGFVAEFVTFIGSYSTPGWEAFTILSATGIVLTAAYMLWMIQRSFFGPLKNPEMENVKDARGIELVPLVILVGSILLVGLFPAILTDVIANGVGPLIERVGSAPTGGALAFLPPW